MTLIAKTLVFLCVLIGSQAIPLNDADGTERQRRDVMPIDSIPPTCRAVNVSNSCLTTCGNKSLDVTYVMTDNGGSGLNYVTVYSTGLPSYSNITQRNGVDNGQPAIFWSYSGICCSESVDVTVIDRAGNMGRCPSVIKRSTTTVKPITTPSGGSMTTVSVWLSLTVMALKSMLI